MEEKETGKIDVQRRLCFTRADRKRYEDEMHKQSNSSNRSGREDVHEKKGQKIKK